MGLNNFVGTDEWEEVIMTIDSGASETVIPSKKLSHIPTMPSEGSKAGVLYDVANGETAPNEGEKGFVGQTEDGKLKRVLAQVCDVNKGLMSVKKMCQ